LQKQGGAERRKGERGEMVVIEMVEREKEIAVVLDRCVS
jgi:hypothetical protein